MRYTKTEIHLQFQYYYHQALILINMRIWQVGKGYQLQACLALNHSDSVLKICKKENFQPFFMFIFTGHISINAQGRLKKTETKLKGKHTFLKWKVFQLGS